MGSVYQGRNLKLTFIEGTVTEENYLQLLRENLLPTIEQNREAEIWFL